MGELKILGLPDLFAVAAARATAKSEASASMAEENLLTEEPSEFWRSTTNTPDKTAFKAYTNGNLRFTVDAAAIVASNLWRETASVRFLLTDSPTYDPEATAFEDLVPVGALAASSNLSGASTDVDSGFAGDSNWMSPTIAGGGVGWMGRFNFNTPVTTPRSGGTYQTFWVQAKADAAGSIQDAPRITAWLYLNNVPTLEIATKAVTSATGQWLKYEWSFDSGTMSGADVQIHLVSIPFASGDAHLGEIVWRVEGTGISGDANVVGDSGWLSLGATPAHPTATANYLPDQIDVQSSKLHCFGAEQEVYAVWVLIREDHAPDMGGVRGENLVAVNATPFGYVEVGKVMGGIVFSSEHGFAFGDYLGFEDLSSDEETEEGQEFGSSRGTRRVATLRLETLSPAEAAFLVERWIRRRGVLFPVLVSLNYGDATEEALGTFYATLRSPETRLGTKWASGQKRSLTLELEEKL